MSQGGCGHEATVSVVALNAPACPSHAAQETGRGFARPVVVVLLDVHSVVWWCETRRLQSRHRDKSKLLQRGHAVVEPDLFDNFAVLQPKHRGSREPHFPTGRGR